jgi:hypothetical protein
MTYDGGGAFVQRPGPLRKLGDLERRMRYLERRKQPAAGPSPPSGDGSQFWLVAGYQALIRKETTLLGYYRFTDVASHTFLDDEYGGVFTTPMIEHAGPATNVALTLDHTVTPPANLQIDDYGCRSTAVNPGSTLDSHGDYLQMDNSLGNVVTKWGAGNRSTYSFEVWINPDPTAPNQIAPNAAGIIIDAGAAGATDGSFLFVDYTTGGATPTLKYSGHGAGLAGNLVGGALTAGTWYHVVVTCDGGQTVLYINGVPVAQDVALTTNAASNWKFMGGQIAKWRTFQGAIAQLALYSAALTPSEVLLHYYASGPSTDAGRWISVPFSSQQVVGGLITTSQIADGAVTSAKIRDGTIVAGDIASATITATQVAAANKDGTAATASMRTLGTGAQQAMAGNDARVFARLAITYSASITPNAATTCWGTITATNGTAFTINAPTNPPASSGTQELTIEISNTSGGALGAISWNAIYVFTNGAFVAPATGKKRFVTFQWNGSAWVERCRANADY